MRDTMISFDRVYSNIGINQINYVQGHEWVQIYGIEEHLKEFRDSDHYGVLYDCWGIEKKEYENRLKTVSMTYQSFSMHDASHSETILRQIAYFLGEERIRQLSPTDTWLILECAYTHDIGMVVSAKELYDQFAKMKPEEFERLSDRMSKSESFDIRMAWNYLEPLFQYGPDIMDERRKENRKKIDFSTEKLKNLDSLVSMFKSNWYEWPMHFTQAFRILIQEWCRPRHAEMSFKALENEVNEKTYEGLIPLRLRHLIAEIAYLHGEKRENILTCLSDQIQGFDGDFAHPRFVAELIRIGDLLDMDNNRFNEFQLAVAGEKNYSSFVHQFKHCALKDFLVTAKLIRVKADFKTEDAKNILFKGGFREFNIGDERRKEESEDSLNEKIFEFSLKAFKELSGWLKMLRQELDFFNKEWFKIVPDGLLGSCPYFEPEVLLINGKDIENDLLDLRYHITAKRASEIIEGSGLYEDIFIAFVREILQNSMDAIKRKIYNEIIIKKVKGLDNPLEFYKYISNDVEQIKIQIKCEANKDKKNICVRIRDCGIGISYKKLKDMQHIGDVLDYSTNKQAREMPVWWKPTGAFGIGMQTIFYFVKMFELLTRTEEERILRKLYFHSTQIGGQIDAYFVESSEKVEEFGYGTEIKIEIPQATMQLLQESSNFGKSTDFFGNELMVYQSKIEQAIKEICGSFGLPVVFSMLEGNSDPLTQNNLLLYCFGEYFIDLSTCQISKVIEEEIKTTHKEYEGFSCWNAKDKVFIRYKWPQKVQKNATLKIYFNEIHVKDDILSKTFQIPFWDVEVYLFSDKAEDFLEINRDRFLYEKRSDILKVVYSTHLNCMRFLLEESKNDIGEEKRKSLQEYKDVIWKANETNAYQTDVKKYLNVILNQGELSNFKIDIDLFIQNNDLIQYLKTVNIPAHLDPKLKNNVWCIDARHKYLGDVRLCNGEGEVRYIIEDVFYPYMDIAVIEICCMKEYYNDYTVIYKTGSRSGMPIVMSDQSFSSYIQKSYADLCSKGGEWEQMRMILPGIEEYQALCVSKLVDNLGTIFEKKWNSAIIVPVTLDELKEILKENDKSQVLHIIDKKLTEDENPPYEKICSYISRYRLSNHSEFDKEKIKIEYRNLLYYIWERVRL